MNQLGIFEATVPKAIASDTAVTFVPGQGVHWRGRYAVTSDVAFHMNRLGTADGNSARVPAATIVIIELFGEDTLSLLAASTSGTVWITKVGF